MSITKILTGQWCFALLYPETKGTNGNGGNKSHEIQRAQEPENRDITRTTDLLGHIGFMTKLLKFINENEEGDNLGISDNNLLESIFLHESLEIETGVLTCKSLVKSVIPGDSDYIRAVDCNGRQFYVFKAGKQYC